MIRRAASFAAAMFVLLVARASTGAQAQSEVSTPLTPGASVERALNGAERHTYVVNLHAGDCAALTVDQEGVDVIIMVLDASGAAVATFDQESRKEGREHVAFVADADRPYAFRIAATYAR
ncbi:MAG: hypothetical protein ACRD1V_21065, partial [Vicinamibacterales bacterium]